MDTIAKDRKVGIISIIGPANAGKSTLVNALVGKKVSIVSSKVQTTRQKVLGIKTDEASQLVFVDTPGFFSRKYRGEMSRFLKREITNGTEGVDAIIFVLDARLASSRDDEASRMISYLEIPKDSNGGKNLAPAIFVLNKLDLIEKDALLPLIAKLTLILKERFGDDYQPSFIPVSAIKGHGLDALHKELLRLVPTGPLLFPEETLTDQTDESFAAEVIREKAFMCLNQELPYGLSVLCRGWEEADKVDTVHADIIVEKDSHKGMVLGKGGQMLERIGTLARKDLEKMYGQKIMLKLFVKVERDWTKTTQGLTKAGYDYAESRK